MKIHKLKLSSGEIVELREFEGGFACPVCGQIAPGDAPFLEGSSGWASGSLDVCPCCLTEYGVDDEDQHLDVVDMWSGLRQKWLDKIGSPQWAIEQLKNNLGLS